VGNSLPVPLILPGYLYKGKAVQGQSSRISLQAKKKKRAVGSCEQEIEWLSKI